MTPFENEIQNVKEKVLTGSLNSVPVRTILLCVYQDSFAKWISNDIITIITIIICDYSELINKSFTAEMYLLHYYRYSYLWIFWISFQWVSNHQSA